MDENCLKWHHFYNSLVFTACYFETQNTICSFPCTAHLKLGDEFCKDAKECFCSYGLAVFSKVQGYLGKFVHCFLLVRVQGLHSWMWVFKKVLMPKLRDQYTHYCSSTLVSLQANFALNACVTLNKNKLKKKKKPLRNKTWQGMLSFRKMLGFFFFFNILKMHLTFFYIKAFCYQTEFVFFLYNSNLSTIKIFNLQMNGMSCFFFQHIVIFNIVVHPHDKWIPIRTYNSALSPGFIFFPHS